MKSSRGLCAAVAVAIILCAASGAAGRAFHPGSDPWWVANAANVDADYVIVAPAQFHSQAMELCATMDQLRGLRAVVITLDEIRDAFPGAIPDSADTASIRDALSFAYTRWRSAPLFALLLGDAAEWPRPSPYDLIPAPHFDQGVHGGWCDGTYAMDAWYGDVVASPLERREIAIGRLPARTSAQIEAYRQKLYFYDALQPALPTSAFVVGDLSLGQDNRNRRPAAQRLMAYVRSIADLDTFALYSYDFSTLIPPAGDFLPAEVGFGRDRIIALINAGAGLLEFFGNTLPADAVAHTLRYDYTDIPQFRAEMLSNRYRWPFAIFSHCKVGAFDEYPALGFAPIEDFVFAPARGAIAAIGKGQMTYHEADEPISRYIYEALLNDGGGTCAGRQIQTALERYLASPLCSRLEAVHTARMVNYVGDPALDLKLGLAVDRCCLSFESGGALPLQNRLLDRGDWISANLDAGHAQARVVHETVGALECGPAGIQPLEGQRSLGICARHFNDARPCRSAWTLATRRPSQSEPLVRLDAERTGQSVLSFWVRQRSGPSERGRMIVDLISTDGRALSMEPVPGLDSRGTAFRAETMEYPLDRWMHVWVRIDGWAYQGTGIDSVVARYEDSAGGEPVVAFVDAVQIGRHRTSPWSGEAEETTVRAGEMIIDGMFRCDDDGDGHSDFWNGLYPDLAAPPAGIRWFENGAPVRVVAARDSLAGMSQMLPRLGHAGCFHVRLVMRGAGAAESDCIVVRLRDMGFDGAVAAEREIDVSREWSTREIALQTPSADRPYLFEVEASSGGTMLREVSVTPCGGTVVDDEPDPPSTNGALHLQPVPTTGPLTLTWDAKRAPERISVRLLASDGRVLGSDVLGVGSSAPALEVDLSRFARCPLATGIYLLEVAEGAAIRRQRVLLIR